MKLILLCLVVAIVFAKPKGSLPIGWLDDEATNAATDAAKDVAQKETDKAVDEARHAHDAQKLNSPIKDEHRMDQSKDCLYYNQGCTKKDLLTGDWIAKYDGCAPLCQCHARWDYNNYFPAEEWNCCTSNPLSSRMGCEPCWKKCCPIRDWVNQFIASPTPEEMTCTDGVPKKRKEKTPNGRRIVNK